MITDPIKSIFVVDDSRVAHMLQHAPQTIIALFTANIQARAQAKKLGIGFVGQPIAEAGTKQALVSFADGS